MAGGPWTVQLCCLPLSSVCYLLFLLRPRQKSTQDNHHSRKSIDNAIDTVLLETHQGVVLGSLHDLATIKCQNDASLEATRAYLGVDTIVLDGSQKSLQGATMAAHELREPGWVVDNIDKIGNRVALMEAAEVQFAPATTPLMSLLVSVGPVEL